MTGDVQSVSQHTDTRRKVRHDVCFESMQLNNTSHHENYVKNRCPMLSTLVLQLSDLFPSKGTRKSYVKRQTEQAEHMEISWNPKWCKECLLGWTLTLRNALTRRNFADINTDPSDVHQPNHDDEVFLSVWDDGSSVTDGQPSPGEYVGGIDIYNTGSGYSDNCPMSTSNGVFSGKVKNKYWVILFF